MNWKYHYLRGKIKNYWINERWIRWRNNDRVCCIRPETYTYFMDDCDEHKKLNDTRKCVIKRKCKFKNYKYCLEAIHLKNKINHLKKTCCK